LILAHIPVYFILIIPLIFTIAKHSKNDKYHLELILMLRLTLLLDIFSKLMHCPAKLAFS